MMAKDEIEKCDVAISADTAWESTKTYEFARQWQEWLWNRDVYNLWAFDDNAHWGNWANLEPEWTFIPAFTVNQETGKHGMLNRQCTHRWKIHPMRRLIQSLILATHYPFQKWYKAFELTDYTTDYGPEDMYSPAKMSISHRDGAGLRWVIERLIDNYGEKMLLNPITREKALIRMRVPKKHRGLKMWDAIVEDHIIATLKDDIANWHRLCPDEFVIQYLGITIDEIQRMKPSEVAWSRHEFPLIDKRMNRAACSAWLKKAGLPEPPKSACVF